MSLINLIMREVKISNLLKDLCNELLCEGLFEQKITGSSILQIVAILILVQFFIITGRFLR